jgi:tetratricopeptide (TPR) repeat protein
LAFTGESWAPRLADARLVSSVKPGGYMGFARYGDLGLFGESIGSTRDHVAVIRFPQGAGFLANLEVVPRLIDPWLDAWRRGSFAPDVAADLAVDASVVLGDSGATADDVNSWATQSIVTSPALTNEVQGNLRVGEWAASLVAGEGLPQEAVDEHRVGDVLTRAQATLRRAGDFRGVETMCRDLIGSDLVTTGALDIFAVRRCLGDALMLQDRADDAAKNYSDAAVEYTTLSAAFELRWGAALMAVHAGDEHGRQLLQEAAVQGGPDAATALVLLGNDDLDRGDVAVARSHYDLALALLDPSQVDRADQAALSQMRQARVFALTNRGVALLRMAQDDPAHPPVCHPEVDADPCRAAAADFAAALIVDPLNSVTLMDQAWVDRAMDLPEAAKEALEAAVAADPSLYPAANDLGVLAARSGDIGAAREAFHSALAVNPDYALGWWNTGVLELREGPSGLRVGQAALARAVRLDPSLAARPADYRTDEAVYRVAFDSVEEVSSRWPVERTYGLAAALLGGIGLTSALARFGHTFLAGAWGAMLAVAAKNRKEVHPRLKPLAARTVAVGRRIPPRIQTWLPWLISGAALATISVWTDRRLWCARAASGCKRVPAPNSAAPALPPASESACSGPEPCAAGAGPRRRQAFRLRPQSPRK